MSQQTSSQRPAGSSEKTEVNTTTTVDSGFISQEFTSQDCSAIFDAPPQQVHHSTAVSAMQLDSGVNTLELSTQLHSMQLNETNDLDKPRMTIDDDSRRSWEKYFLQDVNGDTCLHTAIAEGFLEAARILIKLAPHQMLLDTHNDEAQTAMHLAAASGQWEVVRWLVVAGAKTNVRNLHGDTPLHIAAGHGDVDVCRAITAAVDRKEIEHMDLLYAPTYKPLNLEQWNYEGQTCLHLATIAGHLSVMTTLLSSGADVNAREGKSGYTPLHIAIEADHMETTRFLVSNCADRIDYAVLTYGGRTVLQLGHAVEMQLHDALQLRGVDFYLSSDDEDGVEETDSDNDDELESQF